MYSKLFIKLDRDARLNLLEFKTCSCWPSWHDSKRCCVVADQNGKQQTIVSDSKHPYFAQYGTDPTPPQPSPGKPYHGNIANAYWVNAANLEAGHKLIDDSGNWHTVVSVRVEQKPLNSYNLEVENDHTFFIRGLGGDAGIWVHNTDCFLSLPPGGVWREIDGQRVYTVTYNQKTIHLVENKAFATGEASYKYGQVSIKNNKVREIYTPQNKTPIDDINLSSTKAHNNSAIIHPEPVRASNGLFYQSNPKHTAGYSSGEKLAGIEPRNSLELFGQSKKGTVKVEAKKPPPMYALDKDGHIHRFMSQDQGKTWHWTGSTADEKVSLILTPRQLSDIRKIYKGESELLKKLLKNIKNTNKGK